MKNQKILWGVIVLAVVAMWFLFHKSQAPISQRQEPVTNAVMGANSTASIPVSNFIPNPPPVAAVLTNISSDEAGITAKYKQSLIGKDAAVTEIMKLKNKNLDIYGKVIDQDGQPVIGANVRGDSTLITGYMKNSVEVHSAVTDTDGRFSFLGVQGDGMGIWPQKDGYFYNLKLPSKRPDNYQADPNNPVVFTMWKISGSGPLTGYNVESSIPYDGTPVQFDLKTGKKTSNGDLRITLSRYPLQIPPGLIHPYDWAVKIELAGGGLIEENDPYPYLAPATGYQSSFDFNMSSNNVPWKSELQQDFYVKSSQGQYGRMHMDIITTSKRPETGISIQFTINPSGSQNLEPAVQSN